MYLIHWINIRKTASLRVRSFLPWICSGFVISTGRYHSSRRSARTSCKARRNMELPVKLFSLSLLLVDYSE